ncbi:MAG: single-stranded DNA-binding protein [Colwellia sp.]|nr:single-stranded DNA-binding protein [Colwellia sp.]MCW8864769.1 single-stranded DNA-binding protein [Colwellia sp.]MCW9081860.1 single-stranded DNA-binding protein [Colwellia sp.]
MHQVAPVQNPQLCSVTLLGNLVSKPDIRYRANPVSAITEVTIATSSKWLDKKTNQYKEWTSYHHVKVEGELVEQALLFAEKGDVILVQGYLSNIKPSNAKVNEHPPIVHASFIQKFAKGYTQSINQIHCSGKIASMPQLITTANNKQMAQVNITISQHVYDIDKQNWQTILLARELHVWGKQAQNLVEKAKVDDNIIIEGKLSYLATAAKTQFIEGKVVHIMKN